MLCVFQKLFHPGLVELQHVSSFNLKCNDYSVTNHNVIYIFPQATCKKGTHKKRYNCIPHHPCKCTVLVAVFIITHTYIFISIQIICNLDNVMVHMRPAKHLTNWEHIFKCWVVLLIKSSISVNWKCMALSSVNTIRLLHQGWK